MNQKNFFTINNLNWLHHLLLAVFIYYINFYTVNNALLSKSVKALSVYQNFLTISFSFFILSLFGIAYYISRHLNWEFFVKVIIISVIYQFLSYFLLLTQNLNNKKFELWNLSKNDFYQFQMFPILFGILGISILIKWLINQLKWNQKHLFLKDYQSKHYSLAMLLSILPVNDSHLLKVMASQLPKPSHLENYIPYLLNLTALLFLISFSFSLIIYVALNSLSNFRSNKPSLSLAITSSLFFALVYNYTLQYGVKGDNALLGYYIFPGATLFQIAFLFSIILLLYLILNRFFPTTLLVLSIGAIVSIANLLKETMRSEPLLLTDFVWLQELGLVSSFVDHSLVLKIIFGLVLSLLLGWYLHKIVLAGKIVNNTLKRIVSIGMVCLLMAFLLLPFYTEKEGKIIKGIPVVSRLQNGNDINWLGFSTNARYKSLSYVWTRQVTKKVMEKPDNYSEKSISKIIHKYTSLAEDINKNRENNISEQTVIYLLSESLSDPARISNVTVSQDVLPNIKSIKANTTSGLMQSDSYGGGTANMEFQTLTSLPFYNFSSSVSVLYSEVFPKMIRPHTISEFYKPKNRIAMHLANANNFNRKAVYKTLGFDKFLASTGSKDKFKNVENVGLLPSDKMVYDNILSLINPKENQFFSVITMQNHVPWSSDYPQEVTGEGLGFTDEENRNLTSYARLLTFTDEETRNFLERLSTIDKPITVVFYGDHLPGLYPDSAFDNHIENKYLTDYFIWSNFNDKKENHPLINSSDFTAALLEHTDSKVSPYYALLTEVLNKASVDKSPKSPEVKAIQKDLRNIQYDLTIGKGYLLKDKSFFNLSN
ncbi:LTA synthase family protein [Streptococcus ictaluri]|uniref:Arylsulfatase n=1 Tax=Streptococcus ictaluri 707-05 TaxID=764299 RepID=G5K3W0_9STRE|nr:LTA synthase family protein [Streptococcus ictaluri]EHI69656.1 arylsulfatase [Streptococcus ictaluri 707-05]